MPDSMDSKLSTNQYIAAAVMFGLSYFLLYVIGAARNIITTVPYVEIVLTLPNLAESPMFWLAMPVFGFWAMFFVGDWVNEQFETKLGSSPIFLGIFFLLSFAAYYIALFWYMSEIFRLNGIDFSLDQIDFKSRLQSSAFPLFVWAGVFGWVARYAVEKLKI